MFSVMYDLNFRIIHKHNLGSQCVLAQCNAKFYTSYLLRLRTAVGSSFHLVFPKTELTADTVSVEP